MAIKVAILAISHSMKVAFVLVEHMLATSMALPAEMLHAAADLARARQQRSQPNIHLSFVATRAGLYTSRSGVPLVAPETLEDGMQYDLIFLPALWRNPQPILQPPRCSAALAAPAARRWRLDWRSGHWRVFSRRQWFVGSSPRHHALVLSGCL
jgi:transcriptional regulator GlxA family with amidase domain